MQTLFTLISALVAVCITALHLVSAFLPDKKSTVINLANIALHIALVFTMLYAGAALELLALAFMLSLLVYALAFEIKRRKKGRGGDK